MVGTNSAVVNLVVPSDLYTELLKVMDADVFVSVTVNAVVIDGDVKSLNVTVDDTSIPFTVRVRTSAPSDMPANTKSNVNVLLLLETPTV